jgi:hypothetical protein
MKAYLIAVETVHDEAMLQNIASRSLAHSGRLEVSLSLGVAS